MDGDNLDVLIGTVGQYLSVLTPAYGLVVKIWNTYDTVKTGKQRCRLVVRRAAWVLKTINEELPKDGVEVNSTSLKMLKQHLQDVLTLVQRLAEMSFFKALLRAGDINSSVEEAHRRLSDCLVCFQIGLQKEYFYIQTQNQKESCRRADLAKIEEMRKKAAGNYYETKRLLDINDDGEEDEAMAAIQKKLNSRLDETSPETQFLKQSLECLQLTTGRSAPKLSNWSITRHDLDFGETIGGGGFSTVKIAKYRKTTVAVKVLKDVSTEALKREIEIWGKLRNDYIVPFYGAAIISSPPLMVSRYMRNGNLRQYLAARPQSNRVKLVYEVCLGMLYLHEENIIHGDLKAVNVLIDDSGKACITDFGLSKAKNTSVTNGGGLGGTLRFMAPEAIKTGILTPETDVYAFGMVIYEAFTESVPFSSYPDNLVRKGDLILERPTSRNVIERGFSDDLWNLLRSCIARDATQRPSFATIQFTIETSGVYIEHIDDQVTVTKGEITTATLVASGTDARTITKDKGKWTTEPFTNTSMNTQASLIYHVRDLAPIRAEVTLKYVDVEFGLSKRREPVVFIDGGKTDHPTYPKKGSFIRGDENAFLCQADGITTDKWELRSNDVIFSSRDRSVFHFVDPQAARQWFDMQMNFAKDGRVDGKLKTGVHFRATGDWSVTMNNWRRVVDGKVQRAVADTLVPSLEPPRSAWCNVDMPKHCVMDNQTATATSYTCIIDPNSSQTSTWRYHLRGNTIISETLRGRTGGKPWTIREEVCSNAEHAQALFNALRGSLERAASQAQRGSRWFSW